MSRHAWALALLMACAGPAETPLDSDSDVPVDTDVDTDVDTTPSWMDAPIERLDPPPELWSHPHGLYDAPFSLTLTPPSAQTEVHYTLDGSDPRDGDALVYSAPIPIDTTTLVRITLVDPSGPASPTWTRSFVFPAHVADQVPPDGWPEQWWLAHEEGPYQADYLLDPEVIDPDRDAFVQALYDAPIVSIAVDPDELFDVDRGIHEHPEEGGFDWEREASVEFLTRDGSLDVSVDCGLRIHGGAGRRPDRSPKKSFRLAFRGRYGEGMLEAPLFREGDVDRHDTLVLRAGYNRSFAHYVHAQRARSTYLHESLGVTLHRQMGHIAPRIRLVHLFLDGMYWGLYQAEERPDAAFMAGRWGGVEEDYDSLNSGVVSEGDDVVWSAMFEAARTDLSVPANYDALAELLELDAYIDYMLLQFSLGNIDWPRKNWWAGRARDGGRFHFFMWDAELTMSVTTQSRVDATWEWGPGEIFQSIRDNEEFRVRFGDAVQRHLLEPDGVLTEAAWIDTWQGLHPEARSVVRAESARWGDHWRDVRGDPEAVLYTVENTWDVEYARVPDFYVPRRVAFLLEDYRAEGLYPRVDAPTSTPDPGSVQPGTILTVGHAGTVWATTDGSDPRLPGGTISSSAFEIEPTGLSLDADVTLRVRGLQDGEWSALRELSYTVDGS